MKARLIGSRWRASIFALSIVPAATAAAQDPAGARASARSLVRAMSAAAAAPVDARYSPSTGYATFLSFRGGGLPLGDMGRVEPRTRSFLASYGAAFGFGPESEARIASHVPSDAVGQEHVRLQQTFQGVPVVAGELMLHFRQGTLVAANGRALPGVAIDTTPSIAPERAEEAVRETLRKHLDAEAVELSVPELQILNRGMLEGVTRPTHLAWFVVATSPTLREFAWVDAHRGGVLLHFSQRPEAKKRTVFDMSEPSPDSFPDLPGTLVRSEGDPESGDPDADAAYRHAGDTYDYFWTQHGRDSYDGAGHEIRSSVHYCVYPYCPYPNAFWDGAQMVYGEGYPAADDVVAHELTHAVTEHSANLFYYMQSGALNESFSDIFGETVDLTNGSGTDTPGVRWQMGEDIPVHGAIRSMMDPTLFGDPGRASDPRFDCGGSNGYTDGGGVHTNSGVPNHAYALMVDGGSYNGFTVRGIGLAKAGRIEYRSLTTYLLSGSGFLDDYDALLQSCADLAGTGGLTTADCDEVRRALDAVELARPPSCGPVAAPPLCSPGWTASEVWADGFENTVSGRWTTSAGYGVDVWNVDIPGWHSGTGDSGLYFTGNASDGLHHLWGYDYGDYSSDSTVEMASGVTLPAGARLQFDHSFGFDNWGPAYFDGGVLEYCTGACSAWQDAGALIGAGARYNGTVNRSGNNLSGRGAFVGDSHGYTSTQLSLASLAGQSVRFRFRIGTDSWGDDYGWYVDGFRIYRCLAPSTATTVTGFRPTTGPAATSVVITGSGFTGATRVLFGGTPATFTVDSATQITAVVPVGATTGPIGVTTPADTGTSGEPFVVTEPCSFEIAPGSATFSASPTWDGQETGKPQAGVVGVTAAADCAWTAASSAGWIFTGSSRTGPGTVDYSVSANKGPARTGSLTIAGRTFTVRQFGTLSPFTASNLANAVVDARLTKGSASWADYDGDGTLDILLTGYDWAGVPATKLLRSDGYYYREIATGIAGVGDSRAAWGDYDNDGDVDLLIAGRDASGTAVTKVYRNDQGAFVDIRASLAGVSHGALAWGDYDNDGDLDVLIAGSSSSGPTTALYRNEGVGVFTDVTAGLPGVARSALAWGDYDGDGDLDLLVAGQAASGRMAAVLRNDSGVFADSGAGLTPVSDAAVAWGDFDNDGDLDLVLAGDDGTHAVTRLYRNDGGVFRETGTAFTGVAAGSVAWGDYDNDGDRDLAVVGPDGAAVYRNEGGGVFIEAVGLTVGSSFYYDGYSATEVASGSSVAWGDWGNDGRLDLLLTGAGDSILYRNQSGSAPAAPPQAPMGLTATPGSGRVTLRWNAPATSPTPAAGLTYSLRLGRTPSAGDVVSPMAASDGRRLVAAPGNVPSGTSAVLRGLPPGTYYWSVQAVDGALAFSPFATESSFAWCGHAISPASASLAGAGGTGSVAVTAGAGCTWTAVSNDNWITLTSGTGGTGNGAVGYSVAANAGSARDGTVTIAGWTFGIHQAAAGCSTALDSPSATVGPAAGTGSVHVTAGAGCAWTAESNDGWIRVTSGANGSGGGTVAYAFEANSAGPRAGTLTVAGRTFSLGQSGPCPASIAPSGASFDETGGAGALVVTTHTGCPWTAVSDVPWITLTSGTSGTGSGTVGYLVAAGPPRNGTLTVAGQPFTVRQNPRLAEALDVDTSWRLLSSSPAWFGQTAVSHDGVDAAQSGSTSDSGYLTPSAIYTTLTGSGTVSFWWKVSSDYREGGLAFTVDGVEQDRIVGETPWTRREIELGPGAHSLAWSFEPTWHWRGARAGWVDEVRLVRTTLAPKTASFGPTGGTGGASLTADSDVSWTAVSNASWITLTSPSSGQGGAVIGFSVAATTGPGRTGTITIAGHTLTVSQSPFTPLGSGLPALEGSKAAWGDYDSDGDLDLLLTGSRATGGDVTGLYRNDGGGLFTDLQAGLPGGGEATWGDYDNDGDLDILLNGSNLRVCRNDGGGLFTEVGVSLSGYAASSAAWGDHDNDGDLDVLLGTTLYRNDGGGVFTETARFGDLDEAAAAWGDYDDDGDLDLVVTGLGDDGLVTRLYRNDGGGSFTEVAAGLIGLSRGSVAWGDYDNDGDPDILLTGWEGSSTWGDLSKVYRNDGGGVFTDIGAALESVGRGTAVWGDYDNDGDLDIALCGGGDWYSTSRHTAVYRNDGGVFTDVGAQLPGVDLCGLAWGDYDNDGDLDLVVTGSIRTGGLTEIYENRATAANTPPLAPTGLGASPTASGIRLSWNPASDGQTPAPGLTYNLRVGTAPGRGNVVSPLAASDGRRRLPALGNAQSGTGAVLEPLPPGTYYWSVQAVDNTFAGSAFAAERSFVSCGRSIAPASAYANGPGGSGSVAVTAGAGCPWTAASNDTWITVTSGASGAANGTVGYSVAANTGTSERDGTMTIAGQTFAIRQAEAGCSYSITPTSATGDPAGGSGTVNVTADAGCYWTSTSDSPWLWFAWGSGDGTGSGTADYGYSRNTAPARTGALTIAGRRFTLRQPAAACDNTGSLNPDRAVIDLAGGDGTVTVRSSGWCGWTAASDDAWITVTSGATGTGAGVVRYSVAASGTARTGTITIAGQTFTVFQVPNLPQAVDVSATLPMTGDQPWFGQTAVTHDGIDAGRSGVIGPGQSSGFSITVSGPGAVAFWWRISSSAYDRLSVSLDGTEKAVISGDVDWARTEVDLPLGTHTVAWSYKKNYSGGTDAAWVDELQVLPSTLLTREASFGPAGGSGRVSLAAEPGVAWTVSSQAPWIALTSAASGSGATAVTYTVAATSGPGRRGTLSIAGHLFTVTQAPFIAARTGLPALQSSAAAWGDSDGDSDFDLLLTGMDQWGAAVARVYRNDGQGVFTDVEAGLPGVGGGAVAWGDYDGDGDLDLLLTGAATGGEISRIYRNDGGMFTDIEAGLPGIGAGASAWGDYDNDGDLDLLLAGTSTTLGAVTRIYRNDGGGAFTDLGAALPQLGGGAAAWGDYDNDGDLDLLLSGYVWPSRVTRLYRNDGEGVFTEINAGLAGVEGASAAWGDYDNDGDLDLLLSGYGLSTRTGLWGGVAFVYRNDGGATFREVTGGLQGGAYGSAAWGDYDNDGDLDFALCGGSDSAGTERYALVYRNEGGGVFTDRATLLPGVVHGTVAWGDGDGDGDLDLLLTGGDAAGATTTVYANQAATVANAAPTAPTALSATTALNQVTLGWAAASDGQTPAAGLTYNLRVGTRPGASDVLPPLAASSGRRRVVALGNAEHGATAVLRALPSGTYYWSVQAVDSAFAGGPFAAERSFSTCGASLAPTSAFFPATGGTGSFILTTGPSCAWNAASGAAWITLTSASSGTGGATVSYTVAANGGAARTGTLTVAGRRFTVQQGAVGCVTSLSPASALVWNTGGGGRIDVVTGANCSWTAVSRAPWLTITSGAGGSGNGSVYYSVAAGPGPRRTGTIAVADGSFTVEQRGPFHDAAAPLAGVSAMAAVAWGDYDNDGRLDLLIAGSTASGPSTTLYHNEGAGGLRAVTTALAPLISSFGHQPAVAWGDYDGDGDLDLFLCGSDATGPVSRLYRNTGGGFTVASVPLLAVEGCAAAWGDSDGDGDLDLLYAGLGSAGRATKLYRNDGSGGFNDVPAGFPGVANGSVAWGDYDNDGDLDVLLTGDREAGSTPFLSEVYRNDGGGRFAAIEAGLPGLGWRSTGAWGDFGNDGNLDILLTGYPFTAKVFGNSGGRFYDTRIPLPQLVYGTAAWGDYDGDGRLDILLSGWSWTDGARKPWSGIYQNDGEFKEDLLGATGVPAGAGTLAWGDYDGDGRLDLVATGDLLDAGSASAGIYHNDVPTANSPPGAPGTPGATVDAGRVSLSWTAAADSETPAAGLTYNVRVGSSPGSSDVMPAMSLVGGRRLLPAPGNAQHGTTAVLRSLPPGSYRWSVQAVDSSFAGSSFTSEGSFTVSAAITGFMPACGPAGTTVTLTGTGFLGATGVAFHGTGATFTVASATSISTRVPPGATSGPISVTTPSGTATSADSFAIACPAPTVTSFSPTSGGVGTAVAITGTYFPGATQVQFNGTSAAAYTVDSATRITATVPNGATTGSIKVTTPSGVATSAGRFTVIPAPSIGSFYPASGPVGTSVRISGSGFEFATRVQVGGTSAIAYSVDSSYQVTVTVPVGAATGPIRVTAPGGIATSTGAFTVTSLTPLDFYTLNPCRLFDTRNAGGPTGGAPLTCGTDYTFTIVGGACGVPADAKAVSLNVTVTSPTAPGNVRLFASGTAAPLVSTLNYVAGQTRANNALAPLGAGGKLSTKCSPTGTAHLIVDVNGYFK